MERYDRQLIEEYVVNRMDESKKWPFLYGAIGYVVGSIFGSVVGSFSDTLVIQVFSVILNGLVGLGIGYVVGKEKSKNDAIQVQLILLQLQIEEHTRGEGV